MKLVAHYQSARADYLFQAQELSAVEAQAETTITLDPEQKRQEVDGFGASFTDSAAYLIDKVLSEQDKQAVMKNLFDPVAGIGLSLIRNPMGASDYARSIYSYDDQAPGEVDPELHDFSIAHDRESILPLTQWAKELNPNLKLFASPWSPPGWMKTTGMMNGGKLKEEYYDTYAQYFVKFIQAYASEGVTVAAVTPQNEPLFMPVHYPSMEFLAHEEATFVRDYLKPALITAGLTTKVFAYDHNWDRIDYAYDMLDYAGAELDGIAWHWYGGRPISQSRVHEQFPQIETHFTEGSGGEWIPEFEPAFSNVMRMGIEIMRNHSRSFILWNMALDENNGPTVPGFGKSTCRGLVKVNQQTQALTYTLDYYALAHFSKFVLAGAIRIETTQTDTLKNVAFLNQDGSIVTVVFNDGTSPQTFSLATPTAKITTLTIEPKAALTLVTK